MPEGDTVWLTAHRLHQALAGRELTLRPSGAAARDCGSAWPDGARSGRARQTHPASNHLEPDLAHAPAHGRIMANRTGGPAPSRAARAHDARPAGQRRMVGGRLPRARRCAGAQLRGRAAGGASRPRPARPGLGCRRGRPPAAPGPRAGDRGGAAGSAQPRRHRQHVQVRGPVHRAGQPVDAGRSMSSTWTVWSERRSGCCA